MGLLKLLLDTHCWIWLKGDWTRLPSPLVRRLKRDPAQLVLSAVSVIEVSIKHATGRLRLDAAPEVLVAELMDEGVCRLSQ